MTLAYDNKARQEIREYLKANPFDLSGLTSAKQVSVRRSSVKECRGYIAEYHYSHSMPDSTRYVFAATYKERPIGFISYGMGGGGSQFISLVPDLKDASEAVELTRLWIVDGTPRFTESHFVSKSIKMLPKDIKLIVSYSDPDEGHLGIVYQACSFIYCGVTTTGRSLVREDGSVATNNLITVYRRVNPEFKDYSSEDIRNKLNIRLVNKSPKHRYVFLRGTKTERAAMYNWFKGQVSDYPKSSS